MSVITKAIADRLKGDPQLASMLPVYEGEPAVFTSDPAPGDSPSTYIVSAGEVVHLPWDTKTTVGRDLIRDIRVYAPAETGSPLVVELIAERVRELFHRMPLDVDGFEWVISSVQGPVSVDERDYYGRLLSLSLKLQDGASPVNVPEPEPVEYREVADSRLVTVGTEVLPLSNSYIHDEVYWQLNEVAGNPGFMVEATFNHGHLTVNSLVIIGRYTGNLAHIVHADVWNYSLSLWETEGILPGTPGDATYQFALSPDHVQAGTTRVRIHHTSPGNPTHRLLVDYMYVLSIE